MSFIRLILNFNKFNYNTFLQGIRNISFVILETPIFYLINHAKSTKVPAHETGAGIAPRHFGVELKAHRI